MSKLIMRSRGRKHADVSGVRRSIDAPSYRQQAVAAALSATMSLSVGATPILAQEAAQPQSLPPLQVEAPAQRAPAKKKKATAAKKTAPAATSPSPQPPPQAQQASGATGSGDGGVIGYVATKSSTATKTDAPLIDIPQSITVVTKEQAKDQGSRDLAKALTYVPGIVMGQGEGHRDAPVIRGVSTTADFFVDGVRDDVQYFRDLYNIDRVEVLKGSNAMIFGRGGGGGVINRVTKKADGERIYEATTTYGSFDTKRVEVDAGQAVTNDFAFRINGMYENSGSYRDFVDLERYGINPTVTFKPDDNTKVRLAYEYFSEDRTVDRGIPSDFTTGKPAKTDVSTFFGNPDESFFYFRGHTATATIEHKFDNGIMVKNHTQYGNYEKFYQNVYANSALHQGAPPADGFIRLGAYNNLTNRESIFNQTDVTAKVDMGGGIKHTLLAGTEFGYQDNVSQRLEGRFGSAIGNRFLDVPFSDPTSFTPVLWGEGAGDIGAKNHTELGLAGVYVQDQLEITRYFELIGGIRFDHFDIDYANELDSTRFSRTDNVWSPRVGAVFKPFELLSFYASYSKSFLPSSGEQFGSLSGGVTGTANLKPEEFINKEIGFKWEVAQNLFFTGAIFQLDRQNTLVTVAPGVSEQVGKTRTEGGELALTGYVTDDWEVVAGYGYQQAELVQGSISGTATTGKQVALVPRHTFSLWNKYHFLPDWAVGVGLISRSDMYANVSNAVTLPGYARVDAALFWDINKDLKAQLNVENVFDTDYYSTAQSDNNITPGSPRAFVGTVTSRF